MHFLFSGEGPTDLGTCSVTGDLCEGASFIYGPLTSIVDRLVQHRHGYSPLETGLCAYVPKAALVRCASELKSARKALGLPGKKRAKETRYFFNNARAMARIATERQKIVGDTAVAILFRDSDGTASAGRGLWDDKRRSMLDGFLEEGFSRGVPMLPKPKSEAWVLCAVKNRYRGCAQLENRSGNDDSPDSLKKELAAHLGAPPSRELLCDLVANGRIDCQGIKMPSYTAFKTRLEQVI